MKTKYTKKQTAQRGTALLTVIIFSGLVFMALVPMFSYLNHMRDVTLRRRAGDTAFYAAESGIARAVSYIQTQPQGMQNSMFNVLEPNAYEPFTSNAQKIIVNQSMTASGTDDGTYKVKIYKENLGDNKLIVESTGQSNSARENIYRRIAVEVRAGSFANYAFFNTASLSTMDGRRRWITGGEEFWGPVHSNRYLFVGYADSDDQLVFHSDVTVVNNEIYNNTTGRNNTIYNGLKETNADYVELPSDLSSLEYAAANGGIQLPEDDPYYDPNEDGNGSNDVPTPPNVFHGDPINNYELSFNGQTVTITNLFSGTSFNKSISPADFNGAIVINEGNLFVNGTVDGQLTMAALGTEVNTPTPYDQASNGNVIINGELKYAGHPASEEYVDNPDLGDIDDVVGIIAERNFALDASVPQDCIVDAHIMVTGQASPNPDVRNWPSSTSSTIYEARGQDGAFFMEDGVQRDLSYIWSGGYHDSTGSDTSGWVRGNLFLTGGVVHFLRGQTGNRYGGYNRRYSFDQRLFNNPPPYYPLTGDSYIALWREERHAGGNTYDF